MSTVPELIAELAALENPKARAINERHGDDHGVGLSAIRAIAKRLKTQHELAIELWATDDTAAQLLALRPQDAHRHIALCAQFRAMRRRCVVSR